MLTEIEIPGQNPPARGGIGYHWIWFGFLAALVLLYTEQHAVAFNLIVLKALRQRWNWGGLFSPSAYLCYSAMLYSFVLPIQWVVLAKGILQHRALAPRRVLFAAGLLLLVLLVPLITDTVIWGSFPFTYDTAGVGRLRLIPFIPWPTGGYGTL